MNTDPILKNIHKMLDIESKPFNGESLRELEALTYKAYKYIIHIKEINTNIIQYEKYVKKYDDYKKELAQYMEPVNG